MDYSYANLTDMKHVHTNTAKTKITLAVAFVFISLFSFSQEKAAVSKQEDALSFKLSSFSAYEKVNAKVMLNWATASEINTSHFIIQRSIDGKEFNDAALLFTQEGDRSTQMEYNYADNANSIKSDIIYYRLKMVELDGKYSYSNPVIVHLEKTRELVAFN
jgi:hypothetical protein